MPWDQAGLIAVRETLARLYPRETDSERVLVDAGLDPILIPSDPTPINRWFLILRAAENRPGKLDAVLAVALKDNPENDVLKGAAAGAPPPAIEAPEPAAWLGPQGRQLEKILGAQSALVPISYLEVGLQRSRPVGRIIRADRASGTGFLVRNGILITNNHVLPDAATAGGSRVLFNYQQTVDGLAADFDERRLDAAAYFRTSVNDDWSAVKVAGEPNAKWGELSLAGASINAGDRVNIIQHPLGQPKQISFYANVVAYVGGNRVQYLTDTEPGSSGAPVFDRDWRLVALHHSGGWLTEPGGPDPTRTYYRNEGVLIDVVNAAVES
jgi:V8-like Glu-specific endopeptidase